MTVTFFLHEQVINNETPNSWTTIEYLFNDNEIQVTDASSPIVLTFNYPESMRPKVKGLFLEICAPSMLQFFMFNKHKHDIVHVYFSIMNWQSKCVSCN